jgi:DMSO/TMAO reductase YedYZ molybdopterin-dependent catalytic subunit
VPVAQLLERAGVQRGAIQVERRAGGDHAFARGVEVAKLLDDAILAYAMNGQDLPIAHGGPVRLVVPGWGGINWVKWIVGMTVLNRSGCDLLFSRSSALSPCRPCTVAYRPANTGVPIPARQAAALFAVRLSRNVAISLRGHAPRVITAWPVPRA